MASDLNITRKNEIVVYQPNETLRLEVKLGDRTVWLSQKQMAQLFGCSSDNVGLHLKNIYADGELDETATAENFSVVRKEKVLWGQSPVGACLSD